MRPFNRKVFHREVNYPSARKIEGSTFGNIWNAGVMVLRISPPQIYLSGTFMPTQILHQLWNILEGKARFHPYTYKTETESNIAHLRQVVAIMGLPPSLLHRTKSAELLEFIRKRIYDEHSKWTSSVRTPDISLESRETRLEGDEKAEVLRFTWGFCSGNRRWGLMIFGWSIEFLPFVMEILLNWRVTT